MSVTKMRLIHYGSSTYDPKKFIIPDSVREGLNKPVGGLWASPIESTYGWKTWCEYEGFALESLEKSFEFTFEGRLFTITPETTGYDIERIVRHKTYDAIFYPESMEEQRLSSDFYGWDCECVIVLNPDCIIL